MQEKKNKAMTIWLAVLSLLVLGLGGYVVYDKFLSDKPTGEKDNVEKPCE